MSAKMICYSTAAREKMLKGGTTLANAATDTFENLVAAAVIGPSKVVRFALQNAASVSGLMLTTEAMITEKPKKEPTNRLHPDMDEMY